MNRYAFTFCIDISKFLDTIREGDDFRWTDKCTNKSERKDWAIPKYIQNLQI